jgi:SAM-dependent methyltransferase
MQPEKYIVDINEGGSVGLERLDYCFNQTTQDFLLRAGLKSGMRVLDIGCGSGVMTRWIADVVGTSGYVLGIENNQNQLDAAIKHTKNKNIAFKLCSAYDIESLHQQFDFVYCRFVLHHLNDPADVIKKIYSILNENGIYAAEEGVVNFAFSYPFNSAWGDEALRCPPVWEDAKKEGRDANIGIKMYTKMQAAGFDISSVNIIHPVLFRPKEKSLLLLGIEEEKSYFMEHGMSQKEWNELVKKREEMVNDPKQLMGFYGSCQISGLKS